MPEQQAINLIIQDIMNSYNDIGSARRQANDNIDRNILPNLRDFNDRNRRDRGNRDRDQGFFMNVLESISLSLLTVSFLRIFKNLLSSAVFSTDITREIMSYFTNSTASSVDAVNDVGSTLLIKFHGIIMDEFQFSQDSKILKFVTIAVYLIYSICCSSYMVFTCGFYFLCFILTVSRRWNEVLKFLTNIFKNPNGAY